MAKIKLNIKGLIPYALFFIVFFALSSLVMINIKKGIEKKMGEYYSSKISDIEEEYRKKEINEENVKEQRKTKEAVRAIREFSPDEIRMYQQELQERIALYEQKSALVRRNEKEIEAFKKDV